MKERLQQAYWPKDESRPLLELTTGGALHRAATLVGDRTALVEIVPPGTESLTGASSTNRRWTYTELLSDAQLCAHWLLSRFSPGEHICLWAPNVPEWVILQYGAALAGLVLVTANPALREPELRYILRRSRAVALIHVAGYRGTDMAAIARQVAHEVRETIEIKDLARILALGSFGSDDKRSDLPVVDPRSAAQIQFTSGTTGEPKGALLHHHGLVNNAALTMERMGQGEDVFVMPMPLFHTAGSVLGVLGSSTRLSTLVLPLQFDPELMLTTIVKEQASVSSGVPTMLSAMLTAFKDGRYDMSHLRVLFSGGAPVPVALQREVEETFGCALVSLYGQTELSPAVCATSPADNLRDRSETSGQPLAQADVKIANPESGKPVMVGQEGEVQVRGYQLMLGYLGQDEATKRTITADGWLKTGDLAVMDARGFMRITGRLSDMIIRGGENIYPAEIEAVLHKHPAIQMAAIFGIPDPHWGEVVAAAIMLRGEESLPSSAELKTLCRTTLAPHKTPQYWFIVETLPLTASGKVQKFELRDLAADEKLVKLADG